MESNGLCYRKATRASRSIVFEPQLTAVFLCVCIYRGILWLIQFVRTHSNPCHWIQFRIFLFSSIFPPLDVCWKMDRKQKGIKKILLRNHVSLWILSDLNPKKTLQKSFLRRSISCIKEIFNLLHSTDCMISCNRVRLIPFYPFCNE